MQPNYDTPYRNETFYETIEASRISNVASRQAHSYADERSSIWNFVRPKRSAVQYGLNATDYVNNRVLEKSGSDILERNTDDDDDEWENDSDTTIIATSTTSLHDSNQNKKYVAHLVRFVLS
ncbi:hypothetical protein AB6A40_003692 [Gnathostoma spinigerum]|uniref:Uncharacterized protein n=1 Tax=Gnathostoma spinigerum TaxID=75299 RepID=A0ABD6EAG2_9BILA